MSNMRGEINKTVLVILMVLGVVLLVGVGLIGSYISASNYGVRAESGLEATWINNQNIAGQYTLKVQEIASVPEMYKNDLKEVVTSEVTSRYGSGGSQASMQWIKEHSVNFDSSMYTKIQQVIESGRNEFQSAQTRLIDEKREYVTSLGSIPRGWFLSMAGFPRVDLAKYKPVVASSTAQEFDTGVQKPIKLR